MIQQVGIQLIACTARDQLDADLLYQTLEQKVIPTFYDRNDQNLPVNWIHMMKSSIMKLGTEYSTNRMVRDYVEKFYVNAAKIGTEMAANNCDKLKEFHVWFDHLVNEWKGISFQEIEHPEASLLKRSEEVTLGVNVSLGNIKPDQVKVEVFSGPLDDHGQFKLGKGHVMDLSGTNGSEARFTKTISFTHGGRCGYQFRVLPKHDLLASDFVPGLIAWS